MSATDGFLSQIPSSTISGIDDDLDTLEEILGPLLSPQPGQNGGLEETLASLPPLQQAKLATLLPYVLSDLVIIYLKVNGQNPHTHPVMNEMKRVKTYMDKIKEAENPSKRPANQTIDKAAASRFIKNALSSIGPGAMTGPPALTGQGSNSRPTVPKVDGSVIGSHLRFDVSGLPVSEKAAAKIAARNKVDSDDSDDDSDEGLDIIDEEKEDGDTVDGMVPSPSAPPVPTLSTAPAAGKRKRPAMDPFAGYDPAAPSSSSSKPTENPKPKSKPTPKILSIPNSPALTSTSMQVDSDADATPSSQSPTKDGTSSLALGKKKKRVRKRKKLGRASELGRGSASASGTGTPVDTADESEDDD